MSESSSETEEQSNYDEDQSGSFGTSPDSKQNQSSLTQTNENRPPAINQQIQGYQEENGTEENGGGDEEETVRELKEEMMSLKNICECLNNCYNGMKKFVDQSRVLKHEQKINEQFSQIYEDITETYQAFILGTTILASDPDPIRIRLLVFDGVPEYMTSLLSFLSLKPPTSLQPQNLEMFNNVITRSVIALNKVMSICSVEAKVYEEEADETEQLAKTCADKFISENGIDLLLRCLQDATFAPLKQAAAETLFVFILTNDVGKSSMVVQRSVPVLMKVLKKETIPIVKVHICAIIREFCTVFPEDLMEENIVSVALQVLKNDTTPDLNILLLEALDIIIKNEKNLVAFFDPKEALVDILIACGERDNPEVLEATIRLLETIITMKLDKFMEEFVEKDGWRIFIAGMKRKETKICSFAVRTLRILIQSSAPELEIGRKIFWDTPSLSFLLKTIIVNPEKPAQETPQPKKKPSLAAENKKLGGTPSRVYGATNQSKFGGKSPKILPEKLQKEEPKQKTPEEIQREQKQAEEKRKDEENGMIAKKLMRVEVSILFALILAQNPHCRRRIREELANAPQLLQEISVAMKNNIAQADIEYFTEIPIIDAFGNDLIQEYKNIENRKILWSTPQTTAVLPQSQQKSGALLKDPIPEVKEKEIKPQQVEKEEDDGENIIAFNNAMSRFNKLKNFQEKLFL